MRVGEKVERVERGGEKGGEDEDRVGGEDRVGSVEKVEKSVQSIFVATICSLRRAFGVRACGRGAWLQPRNREIWQPPPSPCEPPL